MPKELSVVRILTNYKLIINAGKKDGIKEGDKFQIIQKGDTIKDPISQEDLGQLIYVKANIEATAVFDKYSICLSNDFTDSSVSSLGKIFSDTNSKILQKLNVDQEDILGYGIDIDEKIKLGDLVRKKNS